MTTIATVAAQALATAPPGARRAVLLLSDGAPNVRASTAEALARVAHRYRPAIGVSALGYGTSHDDTVLGAVAAAGGGTYRFIPHPMSCKRDLAQALGAQADVVADAIELSLTPAEGVEIVRFYGTRDVRFGRGALIAVPDMEDDSRMVVAVELKLRRPISAKGELLGAAVRYRAAGAGTTHEACAVAAVDVKAGPSEPDVPVLHRIYLLYGEEERQRARALADRGEFHGACAVLRMMVGAIDALPGFVRDDGSPLAELREAAIDEAVAFERRRAPEAYDTDGALRWTTNLSTRTPQGFITQIVLDDGDGVYVAGRLDTGLDANAIDSGGGPVDGRAFVGKLTKDGAPV